MPWLRLCRECREGDCPENAVYDSTQDQCVCKSGYIKDENGDCVEIDYSLNPDNGGNGDNGDNGDTLQDDSDDDSQAFDIDAHLKEYGVWYGFGFAGLLAMSLLRPKRG